MAAISYIKYPGPLFSDARESKAGTTAGQENDNDNVWFRSLQNERKSSTKRQKESQVNRFESDEVHYGMFSHHFHLRRGAKSNEIWSSRNFFDDMGLRRIVCIFKIMKRKTNEKLYGRLISDSAIAGHWPSIITSILRFYF